MYASVAISKMRVNPHVHGVSFSGSLFGKMRPVTTILAALMLSTSALTNAHDIAWAMRRHETNLTFDLKGKIVASWPGYPYIAIEDGTGAVVLSREAGRPYPDVRAGDAILAHGIVTERERMFASARCLSIELIGHGQPPSPASVSIAEFNDGKWDSRLIRLRGYVRDIFTDELDAAWTYLVLFDGNDIAYAAFRPSTANRLDLQGLKNCEVIMTGLCNPDEGGARHHAGRMLIAKDETSITIIAQPSWITPTKLLVAIAILSTLLLTVLVWNASLRIFAERRTHELLREKIAHVSAELRTDERMRIATELHDSIAQSLTGVSFQINAARRLKDSDPASMVRFLDLASMSLLSCRAELRNCLWDLRSQALDEPSMEKAIRQTLLPYLDGAKVNISFDVPRSRLSDNTMHTLLLIVRELASNATTHGHARHIWISGAINENALLLSVRDDGCGFMPDKAPGAEQGHFGLQGIRERIRKLAGSIKIASSPGNGCMVSITLFKIIT